MNIFVIVTKFFSLRQRVRYIRAQVRQVPRRKSERVPLVKYAI
jgi:hypothetical protein